LLLKQLMLIVWLGLGHKTSQCVVSDYLEHL
jgi:hypothetical protein